MKIDTPRIPQDGEVIEWQLRDEVTLEPCMKSNSREDVRRLKRLCGSGVIVKIVVTH